MSGGKGKAQTVGYKHYVGMHLIACHGPADKLTRLTVDERTAWSGVATGGQITVNAPELFGGEGREGGVSGTIDVEMGLPSQTKNSYLLSKIGSAISAYRGVVGLVFRHCYMGNNPYLKPWRMRMQRIHLREDGAEQWYDQKAEIGNILLAASDSVWDYQFTANTLPAPDTVPAGGWTSGGIAPFGQDETAGFVPPFPIQTAWPDDTGIWIRTTVNCTGGIPLKVTGQVENAAWIFWDGELVGTVNPTNADTSVVLTIDVDIDAADAGAGAHELAIFCLDDFIDYTNDNTYIYAEVSEAVEHGDMNPAHIIRECLTNPDWGMGYTEDDIDEDFFQVAADKLFAERMGISLLWDRQTTLESFISEIIRHIDGALYVSRTTGKFRLKLTRFDYDVEDLITLDESNIDKIEGPSRPAFGELVNSVSVRFWNYLTGKDDSVTVQDPAGVQMQGAVINTTLQYPGFTNGNIGTRVAARDLRALSNPFLTCTVYAGDAAADLDIGDTFKMSWSKWNLDEVVMRVTGFALSDGRSNQIRINCVEDEFDTPLNAVVAPPTDGWVDPSGPPEQAAASTAFEIPYFEMVQEMGQADADSELTSVPERGFVGAAAMRGGTASISARLWTDDGDGYEQVDTMDLCPGGFLVADIEQMDTALTLEDFEDLDLVEIGTHAQIGDGDQMELVRIDAIDPVTGELTVGRGVLDTTPKIHEAGTIMLFWDRYPGFDPTEYVDGETIDAKITPISGQGQVALADVVAIPVTLDQRAFRPYPPGKLQFDTEDYPALVTDDSPTVTWAHRDRLLQTSGTIEDHTAGDIGPEAGTTYEIDIRDDGDPTILQSYTGIAGTSQVVDLSTLLTSTADVEVYAARDGLRSMQPARHVFEFTTVTQFIIFPLTYDETSQDQTGADAMTWTRQGAGPHITPAGFEGDGGQSRYKSTTIPSWMASETRRTTVQASITVPSYHPQSGSNGDTLVHLGADAAGANPAHKLRIAFLLDSTLAWAAGGYLALQTREGAFLRTIPIARPFWKYRREFPAVVGTGGVRIRPQAITFIDNDTALVAGHRDDLESLCWTINTDTNAIEGSFTFGTVTNRHIATAAKNAAGDLWMVDYETDRAFKIDLANSLSTGTAVILTTWTLTAIGGVGSIAFVTVSGTEYVLMAEFGTSGTQYLYVYTAASMTGSATVAGRYKRFPIGTHVQGIAVDSTGALYVSRSTSAGQLVRYDNIGTQITTVADGGALTQAGTHVGPSEYMEDVAFHPVTGEIWALNEGWQALDDFDGFCAIWSRSVPAATTYEHHVAAYYDGNGKVGVKLNGRPHSEKSYTPTQSVDCVSIGGPPQATADFGGGFTFGTIRNLRMQNKPLDDTEYADTISGSFEPNVLTTYTITLANPGAESGATSGWTAEVGTVGVRSATPAPKSGSNYFTGGAVAQAIQRQRFSIATVTGLSTAAIDAAAAAGGLWARARWWQTSFDSNDPACAGIRTLDGTPTQIALSYSTLDYTAYPDSGVTPTWYPLAHSKAIESGARNIDLLQRHDRTSGTNSDGYQDDFSFVIYKK